MNSPPQTNKQEKIATILRKQETSIQNGALCFREGNCLPEQTTQKGLYGRIQNFVKQHGRLYYLIVRLFSAVRSTGQYRRRRDSLLDNYGTDAVIINYGSGPQLVNGRTDVINTDLFAFDEVDVVSETVLPFQDDSVDYIMNFAVLEHMSQASVAVNEMYRCLKPGGEVLAYVPFMQPFHAAPHDYFRWTQKGAAELFGGFSHVEVGVGAGPMSGFLWIFQEWVSIVLSFGSSTLKDIVFMVAMLLTFPLKWLDILFIHYPSADRLASGFFVHARK